jgi:methyl-accepting chemotaxis protein
MLRASTKQSVYSVLDETYFGASNFDIEYGEGNPLWVRITFVGNSNFTFVVERGNLGSNFYGVSEAPGVKLLKPDLHTTQSFESAISRIPNWVQRIKEEVIDSNPISRELQEIRKQLEERIDLLADRQEEFFTQHEATELSQKLSEFAMRLDELSRSNNELSETVTSLKSKLQELSGATQEVNKGTWLRMASSKLLSATKSILGSKEAREFALEAAKKVLLEGPK